MAEFVSTETRDDGSCTVSVAGEVDIATVDEFLDAASCCLDSGGTNVVIDLGGVTFIDSSGLGALVRIRNLARERGADVTLDRVPDAVARLLEVTGLAAAFVGDGNR
ncbi:MAG: STAS domain-containing protein [Marmoricola sp.]